MNKLQHLNFEIQNEVIGKELTTMVLKKTVTKIAREKLNLKDKDIRWYDCSLCQFNFSSKFEVDGIKDVDFYIDYGTEVPVVELRVKGIPLSEMPEDYFKTPDEKIELPKKKGVLQQVISAFAHSKENVAYNFI